MVTGDIFIEVPRLHTCILFNRPRRSLFQNIYGWSVGVRDTSYATKMQWSMWEDRVEEVLTPIMLEAAKEQGVTNDQC